LLLAWAFALCAAAPAIAQSQSDIRLALKGYDPVAYFLVGVPVEGRPELETVFDETRYRFASTEHRDLFLGDPDRYAPQFAGACTKGLSKGMKVEADPLLWRIVDGKLYVFAGASGPADMDSDPQALISDAQENWTDLADKPF
jgi:hypothetical protein